MTAAKRTFVLIIVAKIAWTLSLANQLSDWMLTVSVYVIQLHQKKLSIMCLMYAATLNLNEKEVMWEYFYQSFIRESFEYAKLLHEI